MKTIRITTTDETAETLLRQFGGQDLDPNTGDVLRDVSVPPVRVDVRASRLDQPVVRPRDFPAERSRR